MELLDHAQLVFNGFNLGLVAWFLSLGFSKVINMYRAIIT